MSERVAVLFAKRPAAGKVKTRLAKHIGEPLALKVHTHMLERTAQVMQSSADHVLVAWSGEGEKLLAHLPSVEQRGADLGARMFNAIADALKLYPESRVVLTGSDIPGLTTTIFASAFDALKSADVVIGPSQDGGYYLIGMRAPHKAVFELSAWSHPDVLSQTTERCAVEKLSVMHVATLNDIDTFDDLKASPLYDREHDKLLI